MGIIRQRDAERLRTFAKEVKEYFEGMECRTNEEEYLLEEAEELSKVRRVKKEA